LVTPGGTIAERLVSEDHVKEAFTLPNRTSEILDRFVPVKERVLFLGALVGVNAFKEKVVSVKLLA
jgi:hypothetical protein